MTEPLKPCPFCGGGAAISADMSDCPEVACDACGASVSGPGIQGAVAHWNTRHTVSVQEAVDIEAIEKGGRRWHGEDHRVVSVRWEPYKPDGQRQMKAKGRWQEMVESGDYWRWNNMTGRPAALRALAEGERG